MHDTIKDYFENLNPICFLSEQSKGIVLKNSELIEMSKGDFLFKQGEIDNKSYFLLEGSVELQSSKNTFEVHPGTDTANYALAQFQPRQYSAHVKTDSVFLEIDKKLLDSLAEKDGIYNADRTSGMVVSEDDIPEEDQIDWMSRILSSDLFGKLPPSNIQKIFSRIEPIEVKKGEVVIGQNDPGDYFYIIEVGMAEVVRNAPQMSKSVLLESLSIGDYFGEEALISECPRNASVIMKTDGDLMRLPKDDFIELIREPLLRSYPVQSVEKLHNEGVQWLDVRLPADMEVDEFAELEIPLYVIRKRIEKLDVDQRYIVCCDDGKQSAIASFLLALRGFDAAYLEGGLTQYKSQVENGFDLSFLNEKDKENASSKVIDFIPRKAARSKIKRVDSKDNSLDEQKKIIDEQLKEKAKAYKQQSTKKLVEQAKKAKSEDEKNIELQIQKQKIEIEKQLAEQAAIQKKEIEQQLAEETAKQKKAIEQQLAAEAKNEKARLEKILAEERAKLKKEGEKRLAEEAAKQKKEIEKQLAEEARKEKQAVEKQLAEERAKQKATVEKQLAEDAAKQKKEIEKQLKEELKKEKEAVERQLKEEASKQKKEIEKQLKEEAQKEKKSIEKQVAEERAKQKAIVEKQLADEKIRQKKLIEQQLIEERARQKAAVEKQLEEERAKQKAVVEKQLEEERAKQKAAVEKQLKDEVEKQKQAIEKELAKQAEKKKQEVEKQLSLEAERRKQAIEQKLAEQELMQKEVIDDIIRTGKTDINNAKAPSTNTVDKHSDSMNKLLNHYKLEKEKLLENIRNKNESRVAEKLTKIKSANKEKEKEHQKLKELKRSVSDSLISQLSNKKSQETGKKVVVDKHKVLTKRYNILNDPRFREHIQRLNVEKEKEFIEEIRSFKKELELDGSDSHLLSNTKEQSTTKNDIKNEQAKNSIKPEKKGEETIAEDINAWIKEQEMIENSPKRQKILEEKKKLQQQLQKQHRENKKIDKIRNQTLMTEVRSALDKESDD